MKRIINIKVIATVTVIVTGLVYSCSDEFLDRAPLGAISEVSLANSAGVNGSLIQTYRTLRGANVAAWYTSPSNWVWGSVRSEEAYKGSEASDQNQLNPIERYEVLPNNGSVHDKWRGCYDGIGMANQTLRLLAQATDIPDAERLQIEAETRFIRGFHHFEAKRTFNKAPYIGESVVSTSDFQSITNDADIYPQIEADLQFAYDNLTPTKDQKGRVNKWAAGAFLAKALLYQNKYAAAKTIFDNLITNGVTSSGEKYDLLPRFSTVFRGANENSKEVIFGVQVTVGDGTGGANSNLEGELPNPHNDGPGGCCGFFQPTQTLANSYRTSAGLPVANPHATALLQHENSPGSFPDRGSFDPRLDWTVGRVGIQFLDWGVAASSWIRNLPNGGPFLPIKNIHTQAEVGSFQVSGGWGQPTSGRNILVMRYSDLLLMAAECEVEAGSLEKAREYVNLVRTRASNPADFVQKEGVDEAAYEVATYNTTWTDQAVARAAVRLERLLELAMEGHRFYDLVRWGVASTVLNDFITREAPIRTHMAGAVFSTEDNYLPIPEYVIAQSTGNIKP
ncbi:MAG: RagB/SusD family nutrient uptake outer membrane protein [Cyclobacteriaceae bacterium]|nr:RagB/SusD family nutrient uptake outer membrane protein [Cyclobacteriaceae bacterium]